jgi:putative transcriptional regulator
MTANHHLDDATVMRFASGDLNEAFATVASAHIAMCDTCRHAAHTAEEIGGASLDSCEPAEMNSGSFEELVLRLGDANAGEDGQIPMVENGNADVPLPLARHIGPHLGKVKWKTIAPGVRRHKIRDYPASGSSLYMLHIAPGTAVPEHGHGGTELTLVLSGAYTDAIGTFSRGDIADLDEHVEHQPMVKGNEPCICLVATEAPTRFKGFFSRLLQPLTGI